MKILFLAYAILASAILVCSVMGVEKQFWIVGGQSNAGDKLVEGVDAQVNLLEPTKTHVVIGHRFAGNPIAKWHDGTNVGVNYASILAGIQAEITAAEAAGDTYVIRGLFFWQGESDRVHPNIGFWQSRFLAFITQLESDLGIRDLPYLVAKIAGNPAFVSPAELLVIEDLRVVQEAVGSLPNGSFLDTIGYSRQDAWHVNWPTKVQVGKDMVDVFFTKFGAGKRARFVQKIWGKVVGNSYQVTFNGLLEGSPDGATWYPINASSPYSRPINEPRYLFRASN